MNDVSGMTANHRSDQQVLGAKDKPSSRTLAGGFPLRAMRDPDLSIEDLRVLIAIGILADTSGSCAEDTIWIAQQTDLPIPAIIGRLERLESRGYLRRQQQRGAPVLTMVTGAPETPDSAPPPPSRPAGAAAVQRGGGRPAQASLHSGMLRRPVRRQAPSIEFDDPMELHPVVASLHDSVQGGVDGFRFWLRTILDPEDVEVFSGWASRQSAEYRKLILKYDSANDDRAIESLLEDTLALVDREKTPIR